jgi:general secretion pathway protein F
MMQFRVRYWQVGDAGVSEELLTSADEPSLRADLQARGQTVLSVQASRPAGQTPGKWLAGLAGVAGVKSQRQAYPLFCREVRTLIHAGMTVVEAVETLSARERLEGRTESLAAKLLERLQQGLSLSGALNGMPDTPAVLIAAVRAGERTSNLIEALDDYLRFDGLVSQLRKKIISAAIYPALVTVVGLAISLFLLLVIMPKFATMYENLRSASVGSTAITIQISQVIGKNRMAVVGALVLIAVAMVWWIGSGLAKTHAIRLARAIPWVQRRIEDFQLAMMYQALALLLKGGYPMTEAMAVAGQSALSPHLKAALGQALSQIERGGSVSQALSQAQLCDEVGRRLMAAAERNGEFYRAADVVSRLHGERFELFVERVTRIVEPLLLLAVALGVGGIVVVMYLPVFDMATQLR